MNSSKKVWLLQKKRFPNTTPDNGLFQFTGVWSDVVWKCGRIFLLKFYIIEVSFHRTKKKRFRKIEIHVFKTVDIYMLCITLNYHIFTLNTETL